MHLVFEETTISRIRENDRDVRFMSRHVLCRDSHFDNLLHNKGMGPTRVIRTYLHDGAFVGWACLEDESQFQDLNKIPLVGFYVVPRFRGQGVMKVLSEKLLGKPSPELLATDKFSSAVHKIVSRTGYVVAGFAYASKIWRLEC